MTKKPVTAPPALDRLRASAPEGPPFLGLLLDEPTMRCLAAGVVNARAEVAAKKVIAALDAEEARGDGA